MRKNWLLSIVLTVGFAIPSFGQDMATETEEIGGPESDSVVVSMSDAAEAEEEIEAAEVAEIAFDGILNPELHEMIMADSNYRYRNHWWTNTCFSLDNDLSNMKGEIWLCLEDSLHPGFALPVKGEVLSGFKQRGYRFHKGLDIDLDLGDTVYAAFSGRVRYSMFNNGGYGNLVIIRHYNGLETYYAHLSKLMVASDEYVEAGQPIGLGGSTGRSYGPHLHFECRFYDNALDPAAVIDFEKGELRDCNLIVDKSLFHETKYSGKEKIMAMRSGGAVNVPPAGPNSMYYTVRSGDSLWSIGQRYGSTVAKLCAMNGLSERSILHIGQRLRVK